MSFTFRQLEIFVAAAQDCNFRRTADRLGISQPSISNQIRALERWAGGELFDRGRGSSARLSAKGAAFLAQAQHLLAGQRQLLASEDARVQKGRLRLRIAAGPYVLDRYIRPALPRFLERHSDFELDFLPPGSAARQIQVTVRNGAADVAVFTGSRSVGRIVGAELIGETPCSLYGNARFARLVAKNPGALEALPFLLPPEGSSMERWMLRVLRKAGISPRNVVSRSQFADVIADMVTSGKGLSVLFDEHMARHVRAGRALRIGPPIESGSRVLLLGPRARSRAAAPFVEFLRSVLRREVGAPLRT